MTEAVSSALANLEHSRPRDLRSKAATMLVVSLELSQREACRRWSETRVHQPRWRLIALHRLPTPHALTANLVAAMKQLAEKIPGGQHCLVGGRHGRFFNT